MGMNNEDAARLVLNIETAPMDGAADYIETPDPPANYKNQEAIDRYVVDAKAKALDRCGLDPDLSRIVAIGWMQEGKDTAPVVRICKDERAESEALRELWGLVVKRSGAHRVLVTFNGQAFDLPTLMRRSLYLDIRAPRLNIDRYRSPHIDLMLRLNFNGVLKPHSLSFYGKRFGLNELHPDLDGSQIAQYVRMDRWDMVEMHNTSQVQLTYDLAERLRYIHFDEDLEDEMRREAVA